MTTLHIIGNGFDLAHDIESKYAHFKNYAYKNAEGNYYLGVLENCYPELNGQGDELVLWCDLERALGNMDFEQAFSMATEDIEQEEDHDFRYQAQMEDAPEYMLGPMFKTFHELFEEWVDNIDLDVAPLPDIPHFDAKGLFLSFNYTETLEVLYNIPPNHIRYLHGRRKSADKLIVGHCNDVDGDKYLPFDPPIYKYEAYKSIADKVEGERKNVEEIIAANHDFWRRLSAVDKVVVYGHSLSEVDRPYFKKIADCIDPASEWYFSIHYRNEQERLNTLKDIENIANYMGIASDNCHTFRM